MAAQMRAEPPLLHNQGLSWLLHLAAICSKSAAKSRRGCIRSPGWAVYSRRSALMSMQCQYGDFRIASAQGLSLPQTLQLSGDRAEGIDEAGADQLHRSDCGYRNQRRDQRIFDCRNAALVLGQPAKGPKVQLDLRAGWANVSAPHHHLRDKLDVAEFGGSRLANR
jgi:hypothetical protein